MIVSNEDNKINWEAKGSERILQNVSNIINTTKGDVPFMRDFGLSSEYIDSNIKESKNAMIADVFDAVQDYENRAIIKEVNLKIDETYGLIRQVKIEVNE